MRTPVRPSRCGRPTSAHCAGALGANRDEVEERIVDLLGCTRDEARHLHSEMLRRKVLVPVAGLLAGVGLIGGIGAASALSSHGTSPTRPAIETVAHNTPVPDTTAVVAAPKPVAATRARDTGTGRRAPSATVTPTPPPAPAAPPAPDTASVTDATVPAAQVEPDARVHSPDEPRVSIPEGEIFTEIDTAVTAPDQP